MNPDFYITTALMGYGHLRAADNVAGLGRGRLVRVDRPPFTSLVDVTVWKSSQDLYHVLSAPRPAPGVPLTDPPAPASTLSMIHI